MARRIRVAGGPIKLTSKKDVMRELGGIPGLMELTGRDYSAVENWKRAEHFPGCFHALMTWKLAQRGYRAHPSLWGQVTVPEMEREAA